MCMPSSLQSKAPTVVEASAAAVQNGPATNVVTHNDPTANAAAQQNAGANPTAGRHIPSIAPVRVPQ